jgi:hypothetical protein
MGVIFCTHRELRWRNARPDDCRGLMIVDPWTEDEGTWIADCDECGLSIGIPPRQRERWLQLKHDSRPEAAVGPIQTFALEKRRGEEVPKA